MKSMSKEMFIMALLIMIVVFMVGIIFYDYMPNNKIVPEPITYQADSSTTSVLQEIASTTIGDDTETQEKQSIIKSYSIGSKELSTAASKNSYTSGKTDPFAEYKEPVTNTVDENGNVIANPSTNTVTNTTTNNGATSQNSTTGTFFEKPNSK